jgi:hypothetical protein
MVQAKNTKEAWTCENLIRKYGDVRFKVGEDDDGYQVKMRPVTHCLRSCDLIV